MARERSPNRDKAFEIYKKNNGNITNREISNILNENEKTISNWKCRDKWNVVLQNNECSTTKDNSSKNSIRISKEAKKGIYKNKESKQDELKQKTNSRHPNARPGNKNALGNKGGSGGPVGNKKALATGEFESIFFDTLEDEELELIDKTPFEKMELLKQEIQLLTVRERRMLQRIADLKNKKEVTLDSETHGTQGDGEISVSNYESTLNVIQRIEDALTRVQDKKQRAIDSLHKYEMDEKKYEIDKQKLDTILEKNNNESQDGALFEMLEGLRDGL
ncbi:MAG: phage terminase small subunit [Paraclostridium sp.]